MGTGFRGAFVISWAQTEVDGIEAAPVPSLMVGATWSWRGEVVRMDASSDMLRLGSLNDGENGRKSAARVVRRLVKAVQTNDRDFEQVEVDEPLMESSFVITNGAQSFTVTVIETGNGAPPLLMFLDKTPPRHMEMWVARHSIHTQKRDVIGSEVGGVICFTPGTRIQTPGGACPVEDLRPGDLVQTKDSGAEEIQWIGRRRMSGARLFTMPGLRPIRIRAGGAFGVKRPEEEFLVSPEHRMLVKGRVAQALFNTSEVLVAAKDLINGTTITVDLVAQDVTYIHLLLPRHQVIWANGVETESFHPAGAALSALASEDRARLLALHPMLEDKPQSYGGFARRNLNRSEAVLLCHEVA